MIQTRLTMKCNTRFLPKRTVKRPCMTTAPYADRVSNDNSERVFFIYYLGCFDNVPMYHFGETGDMYNKELAIKAKLPFYTRVFTSPIDYRMDGIEDFRSFLNKHNMTVSLPVHGMDTFECFQVHAHMNIDDTLDMATCLFSDVYVS